MSTVVKFNKLLVVICFLYHTFKHFDVLCFSFLRSVLSRIEKEQHRRFRLLPTGGDIFQSNKGPVSWPLWELSIFLRSSFGHSFSHKYDDFDSSVTFCTSRSLTMTNYAQLVFQINYRVHRPLIVAMFLRHAGVMMVTSWTPLSPSAAALGLVNLMLIKIIKFEHHCLHMNASECIHT